VLVETLNPAQSIMAEFYLVCVWEVVHCLIFQSTH